MAYPYSLRVFSGFGRRPNLETGVLLGSIGLGLAATLLLLGAGSPAPAAPTTSLTTTSAALPFGSGYQLPVPATLDLLASLPSATSTWLPPYPAGSRARQYSAESEAVAVVYHPTEFVAAAANSRAIQRSWDTIKRMFR